MKVHNTGLLISTVSAVGAIGFGIAAAQTAATVALVAYSVLAVGCAALSISSITAAFLSDPKPETSTAYFQKLGEHTMHVIPGLLQIFVQAVIRGVAEGISGLVTGGIDRNRNTFIMKRG